MKFFTYVREVLDESKSEMGRKLGIGRQNWEALEVGKGRPYLLKCIWEAFHLLPEGRRAAAIKILKDDVNHCSLTTRGKSRGRMAAKRKGGE